MTLGEYVADRERERQQVHENALQIAYLAAREEARILDGARILLTALADMPEARPGSDESCDARMAQLVRRYPLYTNMGVIGRDGMLACSAIPSDGPLYLGDRLYFRRAVETGRYSVGEHVIGRLTGKPTMTAAYPVVDEDGEVREVWFIAVDMAWLNDYASQAQLTRGSVLLVVHRHGTYLARVPESSAWVGRQVGNSAIVWDNLARHGKWVGEGAGADGEHRLYAVVPLGGTRSNPDAYLGIGIPVAVAYAHVDRGLVRDLAVLFALAGMALLACWMSGELFILRPVARLMEATRRLSAGDLGARVGSTADRSELGQLQHAFDEMAESLQRAEELRRLNVALEQENRAVAEASRLKTEFVSMVIHELRTPLTSVLGYAALLIDEEAGPISDEQGELLTIVQNNSERLLALINGLLDVARIEAGKLELERRPLDMAPIIRDMADSIRPLVTAKDQTLMIEVQNPLPPVWADPHRMTQVLTNLVSNAHKYTPSGGTITVRAGQTGDRLRIEVRDNGIGLTPTSKRTFSPSSSDRKTR